MRYKLLVVTLFLMGLILSFLLFNVFFGSNISNSIKKDNNKNEIIDINKHYSDYVITNKESKLYIKQNNKYLEYGKVNEGITLNLEKQSITSKTKYFLISGLNLYISYNDVDAINKLNNQFNRYKNYIPFNNNIVTKNPTIFYDEDNNYVYTINKSFDLKVIIKDNDRYGIEYNNKLLYINKDNIEKIYDNDNNSTNKQRLKTLTYHLIYNKDKTECKIDICQSLEQFESHLKYLRENDYFTLKLNEMEMYLDGKINIPEKSIVLTIDDGTVFDLEALKLLEKYKVNATMFVITKYHDNMDVYKSDYLDLESHTNNMHNQYECKGYGMQGGGILCLDEKYVLDDLKLSQDKLNGSKYFAYPFFDFNDRAINLLKQAGFRLAFIGQYNTDGYSYPNQTDKYKVPRKTIFSTTTMDEFISYLE